MQVIITCVMLFIQPGKTTVEKQIPSNCTERLSLQKLIYNM